MFHLPGALAVAGLLAVVQLLVQGMQDWWGSTGLMLGTLLSAMADLHAALAAAFLAGPPAEGGRIAVGLALMVHAGSKSLTAGLTGGGRYLAWLAPGLWLHTLLAVGLLVGT